MVDMRTELEVDSQLERTWWELSNQFEDAFADEHLSILVAIGIATAFLTFVAATVTVLNEPSLWWVAGGLTVVGMFVLGFVWELAGGALDSFR